jgi:hypothetical protein
MAGRDYMIALGAGANSILWINKLQPDVRGKFALRFIPDSKRDFYLIALKANLRSRFIDLQAAARG